MAGISSPGIGSGLDINGLVSKLMAVEQQPLAAMQKAEASYQAKLSAFGILKGALSDLQNAASALTSASAFSPMTTSVADTSVLTASASSSAAAGTYAITVSQLAQAQVLRSATPYAATTETFNTGTISISVGGAAATQVTIGASNNTLAGIRDAINNANAGATATIVNDGTTNRLLLTANATGLTAGAISVTVTDSGAGGTHALTELNGANLVTVKPPLNAMFNVNGIDITRSSNSVSDVIAGVTLNLTKAGTVGSPVSTQLTVAKNTSSVQGLLTSFVNAYNGAIKQIKSLSAYNAETKQASILTGNAAVRGLQSQLGSLAQSAVTGVAGSISRLSDIGITVQKDGSLALDAAKVQAALTDPTKDVATLFTSATTGNTGLAVRFKDTLTTLLGSTGPLSSSTDGINRSISDLRKREDAFQTRLVSIEARYRRQFTALDSMVASMQRTSTYLSQQLANLPSTK